MKKNLLAMVAVALLAGPMAAQAIPMRFDATTNTPTVVGSWFADFNDTGDGLFSLNELTAFSGVTCITCGNLFFGTMTGAATVAGFSSGGGNNWIFSRVGGTLSAGSGNWSYRISSISVPEPGTLALFGLGLAGLGFARRRRATH